MKALPRVSASKHLPELWRPMVLATVSAACILVHGYLLRAAAHAQAGHVLLGPDGSAPTTSATTLALGLAVARFVAYVVVPGLVLAAAAEAIAYVLVGPRHAPEREPHRDDERERSGLDVDLG